MLNKKVIAGIIVIVLIFLGFFTFAQNQDDEIIEPETKEEEIDDDTDVILIEEEEEEEEIEEEDTVIPVISAPIETNLPQVELQDETKPTISILGENVLNIEVHSIYIESGATATDDIDGDLTDKIVINNSVNINKIGEYKVVYSVEDSAGNIAVETRIVNVVDNTPPVITIIGENIIYMNPSSLYTDQGAEVNDNYDENIKLNVFYDFDSSVMGEYIVTYSATDSSGNSSETTRTVIVTDITSPTVKFLINGSNLYGRLHSSLVKVFDNIMVDNDSLKYIWTETEEEPDEMEFKQTFKNNRLIISPKNLTGKYYLWILSKDTFGNTTIARSNEFYFDNTAPIIDFGEYENVRIEQNMKYKDYKVTATDNINGDLTNRIIRYGNVNTSKFGIYNLNYFVYDNLLNTTTATRKVTVVRALPQNIIFTTGMNPEFEVDNSKTELPDSNNIGYAYDDWDNANIPAVLENCKIKGSNTIVTQSEVMSTIGEYVCKYSATDSTNHTIYNDRVITIVDKTAPIINFKKNIFGLYDFQPINIPKSIIDSFTPKYIVSDNYYDANEIEVEMELTYEIVPEEKQVCIYSNRDLRCLSKSNWVKKTFNVKYATGVKYTATDPSLNVSTKNYVFQVRRMISEEQALTDFH